MGLLVGLEVSALGEGPATAGVWTDVGLFAGMSSDVDFQGVRAQEGSATMGADVRSRRSWEGYRSLVCLREWSFKWPRVVKRRSQPDCVQT